ncbi:MAG TPA: hypothetical protein VNA19_01180 [Pyrinomonadaceae bacterium]|jgi:hypothetical protein|nr:hypothetical protein [Pyrinomonadaceae bacterium]
MRKILCVIVGFTFWAMPANVNATIFQTGTRDKPCPVRTIYVAELGADPRHVNFRLFLEKWLAKKKFTVAKRPEDADAVLKGTLSISSGNKSSNLTFKDAELKTARGATAWHGNFDITTKNAFGWLGRGHIENGAKRIAGDIRAACK